MSKELSYFKEDLYSTIKSLENKLEFSFTYFKSMMTDLGYCSNLSHRLFVKGSFAIEDYNDVKERLEAIRKEMVNITFNWISKQELAEDFKDMKFEDILMSISNLLFDVVLELDKKN